jgi:hypothetical protein
MKTHIPRKIINLGLCDQRAEKSIDFQLQNSAGQPDQNSPAMKFPNTAQSNGPEQNSRLSIGRHDFLDVI